MCQILVRDLFWLSTVRQFKMHRRIGKIYQHYENIDDSLRTRSCSGRTDAARARRDHPGLLSSSDAIRGTSSEPGSTNSFGS
mmetsp:Transcript_24079/g.62832  ORF Transcript_24079/g.62832 Transcript_24079/m.62832 type:complete len:82 (+) Transcript_24079:231-476(+)